MIRIEPGVRSRTIATGLVLSIALVTGGWLLERGTRSGAAPTEAEAARLFDNVFARVAGHFVDSLSESTMYRMAVDGMLYELEDPYTSLLAPDKLGRLNETTSGNYAGVGVQVDVRDGWIVVIAPTPGQSGRACGHSTWRSHRRDRWAKHRRLDARGCVEIIPRKAGNISGASHRASRNAVHGSADAYTQAAAHERRATSRYAAEWCRLHRPQGIQ